jgi:glycosyltransferase
MYRSHGRWGVPTKIMKMMWKVPQFIEAKFVKA